MYSLFLDTSNNQFYNLINQPIYIEYNSDNWFFLVLNTNNSTYVNSNITLDYVNTTNPTISGSDKFTFLDYDTNNQSIFALQKDPGFNSEEGTIRIKITIKDSSDNTLYQSTNMNLTVEKRFYDYTFRNGSGGGAGGGGGISGDFSDCTVNFTQASSRTNITSGSTLSNLFGKIKKWLVDLKEVAFSGSYNDLSDTPTIPTVNDSTITFTSDGSTLGTFSTNQSNNKTIDIPNNQISVDSSLSSSSTNPVQNKVIKSALDGKQSTLTFDVTPTSGSNNPVTSGGVYNAINNGINNGTLTLTSNGSTLGTFSANQSTNNIINIPYNDVAIDSSLSSSSTNPVQNKIVKSALDGKQDILFFDTEPTEDSTKMLNSGAIFAALQELIPSSSGNCSELSTYVEFTKEIKFVIQASLTTSRVKLKIDAGPNNNTMIPGASADLCFYLNNTNGVYKPYIYVKYCSNNVYKNLLTNVEYAFEENSALNICNIYLHFKPMTSGDISSSAIMNIYAKNNVIKRLSTYTSVSTSLEFTTISDIYYVSGSSS